MKMLHLVSDPDKFDEAVSRNFPFFRTACGTAQPNSKLTKNPDMVTCPLCRKLIEQMIPPTPHPKHAAPAVPDIPDIPDVPPSDFELDDDLFDDINELPSDEADDLGAVGQDAADSKEAEENAGEGGLDDLMSGGLDGLLNNLDKVADLVGMAMPMLSMVVGDCPTDPDWKRWVLDEHAMEPFPAGDIDDIRVLLDPVDLAAIRSLYGFGKDFGLDPLFGLLISILHRQVVARAEALDASMESDDGVDEDDEDDEASEEV